MNSRSLMPILAVLLLAGCVSQKAHDALQADLQNTRSVLETEKRDAESLASRLKATEENLATCRARALSLEDSNAGLQKEVDDLNGVMASMNASCEEQVREMNFELEKQKSIVALQATVINRLDSTKREIEESLKEQIEAKEVLIEEMENRLKVSMVDEILFSTGQSAVNEKGQALLAKIAETLKGHTEHEILVEGYTDNVPIGAALKGRYPTNWELSAARALSVVRFIEEKGGLDPARLSAVAFGKNRPVASNETAEGRSRNRRIEIILVPKRE